MAAGQTVYRITKDNYDQVRAKLNHSSIVMDDIRDGINAGNTVTIHERTLSYAGWSGAGYTILNPTTGSGAYMIGGGIDGGSTEVNGDNKWFVFTQFLDVVFDDAKFSFKLALIDGFRTAANGFLEIYNACKEIFSTSEILPIMVPIIAISGLIGGWGLLAGLAAPFVVSILISILLFVVLSIIVRLLIFSATSVCNRED